MKTPREEKKPVDIVAEILDIQRQDIDRAHRRIDSLSKQIDKLISLVKHVQTTNDESVKTHQLSVLQLSEAIRLFNDHLGVKEEKQ